MKSSLPLVAGTLVLAALTASGDETKTYKVRFDDVWKVGDVVTRESKQTESTDIVVKQETGTVVSDQKGSMTTEYRAVEKCLAAENGKATKRLVWFQRWSARGRNPQGPVQDDSLTGTHVEISGSGPSRAWKVLTPGKEISEIAKMWLANFGGESSQETRALLSPPDAVAPGATWKPDVAKVVKSAAGTLDADLEKSAITVAFVEVQPTKAGEFGKFTLDVHVHTRSLQGPQGPMPWREGGTLRQRGVIQRSLAEGSFDGESAVETTLDGVAQGESNEVVTFHHKKTTQDAVGTGGEMPPGPVTTTPAPAAPAPAPARPPAQPPAPMQSPGN